MTIVRPSAATLVLLVLFSVPLAAEAQVPAKKPNVLVIFGDNVGIANVSAYSDGLMGYTTPNIDRIATEGVRFLHNGALVGIRQGAYKYVFEEQRLAGTMGVWEETLGEIRDARKK